MVLAPLHLSKPQFTQGGEQHKNLALWACREEEGDGPLFDGH